MSSHADLTPRQAKFVANFLLTGIGTQAAMAAGYSQVSARVTAHRLLTKAAVRAAISAGQGVDAKRLQIERQDIIKGLVEAFQVARERREPASMISACRELGRLQGYYAPEHRQINITSTDASQYEIARLEAMSDAELLAVIGS